MLGQQEECLDFDPFTFVVLMDKVVVGKDKELGSCFRNGVEYIEDLPSDTTANIYTHLKQEALCKASVNMEKSFASRSEPKSK